MRKPNAVPPPGMGFGPAFVAAMATGSSANPDATAKPAAPAAVLKNPTREVRGIGVKAAKVLIRLPLQKSSPRRNRNSVHFSSPFGESVIEAVGPKNRPLLEEGRFKTLRQRIKVFDPFKVLFVETRPGNRGPTQSDFTAQREGWSG
jgi:hypothetical protein